MREVTFGITTFERPRLLENLIRSILHRYPLAKIVVADNGKQRATLPDSVTHLELPFDCGLSRARNALVDALETEFLLILEDDFLFNDQTKIESLLEVLSCAPEVGVVGGAIRSYQGRVAAYALDIEVFRSTMYVREATHRLCFTPQGLPYRLCDMIWNFALFRREMLTDHRWIDRLKVGEHCPYFHQVKRAQKWRVAMCADAEIEHLSQNRSPEYLKYRRRAQEMFESYLAEYEIDDYQRILPVHFEDDEADRPNVIVLGVGHSGTSVLSQMLHRLGWCSADADEQFGESVAVRRINCEFEASGRFPREKALKVLKELPRPWVLKDPRFVNTLGHWMPLFALLDEPPTLLRIRRDRDALLRSYARRNAPGNFTQRVDRALEASRRIYRRWPWERLTIEYERIAGAVGLFDPERGGPSAATVATSSGSRQADLSGKADTILPKPAGSSPGTKDGSTLLPSPESISFLADHASDSIHEGVDVLPLAASIQDLSDEQIEALANQIPREISRRRETRGPIDGSGPTAWGIASFSSKDLS